MNKKVANQQKTPTAPPPLVFFLRLRKKVVPLHHKTQKSRL